MPEATPFNELIRRVRGGDDAAAAELVRQYEIPVRVELRSRLRHSRLRPVLDSVDVLQEAMASLFAGMALGRWDDLRSPGQLVNLLRAIAENKLRDHEKAARRKKRPPIVSGRAEEHEPPDKQATPSWHVSARELLEEFRRRLSDAERWLAERRAQDREWTAIAADCAAATDLPPGLRGKTPEALRKLHARGLARVASELGLKELSDD
jgi:DNA-directed RNA polymerase specialized sigma24 family protein